MTNLPPGINDSGHSPEEIRRRVSFCPDWAGYQQGRADGAAEQAELENIRKSLLAQGYQEIFLQPGELHETVAEIGRELFIASARYEYLRKLNPREFAALWKRNIETGTHFDDLVDQARET
jgi:hypothetical protein